MTYIWTFGIIQKKFIEFEKKFKMVLKKMRRKKVIYLSVGQAINSLNSLINNLCENCVLLCYQISIFFVFCCHILDQNHNTLASIVCFKKLFT
jgi:hypothetical protein